MISKIKYNETLVCPRCGYVYPIGKPVCPKCGDQIKNKILKFDFNFFFIV